MLPSFHLFGNTIYLYPLLMGLAWGLGVSTAYMLAPKDIKNLGSIMVGIFSFSWIGAKIFFLLTSDYINKSEFLENSNFWLGGGFVFFGGLIFGFIFLLVYCKFKKIPLETFSFLIISLGLGHGIGRIGCFLAGCCHGVTLEFDTVTFLTPVQLLESSLIFLITYFAYKKLKNNEQIIVFYLISYSVVRFFLEFLRSDEIRGQYLGLSTSQLISVAIIVCLLVTKKEARFSSHKG